MGVKGDGEGWKVERYYKAQVYQIKIEGNTLTV